MPLNPGFFIIGAASYFAWRWHDRATVQAAPTPDTLFAVGCLLALLLFLWSGKARVFIPVCFWMIFLALLCEGPEALSRRALGPCFTHPAVQYLGRISYCIYLSHEPVMVLAQAALLVLAPALAPSTHFWTLLVATLAGTLVVSAVLHFYIEAPGMALGRSVGRRARVWVAKFA